MGRLNSFLIWDATRFADHRDANRCIISLAILKPRLLTRPIDAASREPPPYGECQSYASKAMAVDLAPMANRMISQSVGSNSGYSGCRIPRTQVWGHRLE